MQERTTQEAIQEFFRFASERYRIFLKRQNGEAPPWTDDKVLRTYSFCNIFREDDRVTKWFRKNLRDPLQNDPEKVIFATVAFRWFNRIYTGQKLLPMLLEGRWDTHEARALLWGIKPIVTGAYIIKTPNGKSKLEGVTWCIENVYREREELAETLPGLSLEKAWERLRQYPYLGDFMSYEVVTDLRHTPVLEGAPDKLTWANPGPGAARGVSWLLHNRPGGLSRQRKDDRGTLMHWMQKLCEFANTHDQFWCPTWPKWEMREAEHTLCEYDKWKRGTQGQILKRRYRLKTV